MAELRSILDDLAKVYAATSPQSEVSCTLRKMARDRTTFWRAEVTKNGLDFAAERDSAYGAASTLAIELIGAIQASGSSAFHDMTVQKSIERLVKACRQNADMPCEPKTN